MSSPSLPTLTSACFCPMEEKVEAQDHRKETASLSLCSHSVFSLQTVKILLIYPVWAEGVALGFRVLFCSFFLRQGLM